MQNTSQFWLNLLLLPKVCYIVLCLLCLANLFDLLQDWLYPHRPLPIGEFRCPKPDPWRSLRSLNWYQFQDFITNLHIHKHHTQGNSYRYASTSLWSAKYTLAFNSLSNSFLYQFLHYHLSALKLLNLHFWYQHFTLALRQNPKPRTWKIQG